MHFNEIASQKQAILLVGVPGSGKSTWIRNFLASKDRSEWAVISTDDILERWGAEKGMNYDAAFRHFNFKNVVREMEKEFSDAIENGKNVIIDMTNMTVKSRARKLSKLPSNYDKQAIVWSLPDPELKRRIEKRKAEGGKVVPSHVMDNMIRSYQSPTKAEGFSKITFIKS